MRGCSAWWCALTLPALLHGSQEPPTYQRPHTPIPKEEKEAIQTLRKAAKPRKVTPRGPLPLPERTRAKVFESAKDSVVHVSSLILAQDLRTLDISKIPAGMGTGFVWDELGHVVTNHHVLRVDSPSGPSEATEVQVTLSGGKRYKAQVIGRSISNDIAVLRVFAPLESFKPLPIGSSRDLVVGQDVLAIGNPFGFDHSLTSGIISALNRDVPTAELGGLVIHHAIQTDAPINPGNSGGPLLDSAGRLVGMNWALSSPSGSSAGIGFSIPVDTLNTIVPALIARGQLERPELGFTTLGPADAAQLGVQKGLVVKDVKPGSAAELAGLKGLRWNENEPPALGDVIVGFKGKTVEEGLQLFDAIELLPPEEPLPLEVLRDGKRIPITIRPGKTPPRKAGPVV